MNFRGMWVFLVFHTKFTPILTIFSKTGFGVSTPSESLPNNFQWCSKLFALVKHEFLKGFKHFENLDLKSGYPLEFQRHMGVPCVSHQVYPNLTIFSKTGFGVSSLSELLANNFQWCSKLFERMKHRLLKGYGFWGVNTLRIAPKQLSMMFQTVCIGETWIFEGF